MNLENQGEELDALLRGLPTYDVGAARAERTRARCVHAMATRTARVPRLGRSGLWWMEPLAASSICLVYLAAAWRAATILLR